jgi:hypothetical protein
MNKDETHTTHTHTHTTYSLTDTLIPTMNLVDKRLLINAMVLPYLVDQTISLSTRIPTKEKTDILVSVR